MASHEIIVSVEPKNDPHRELLRSNIVDGVAYIGAVGSVHGDLTNWNGVVYETKRGAIFRIPRTTRALEQQA